MPGKAREEGEREQKGTSKVAGTWEAKAVSSKEAFSGKMSSLIL